MLDIRNKILEHISNLDITLYQVSKLVKDRVPKRTVYAFLSGEKDTGTKTASILMEALGLKVEIEKGRTENLRAEIMEKIKTKSFLGRIKKEWEKAGKPNWNLRELLGICLLIDLEFRIEGLNPTQKFRNAIESKNYSYLITWAQGLKFKTWK